MAFIIRMQANVIEPNLQEEWVGLGEMRRFSGRSRIVSWARPSLNTLHLCFWEESPPYSYLWWLASSPRLLGFLPQTLPCKSVQFSHSVVSDSLRPQEPQHTRPPCTSNSRSPPKPMSIESMMPSNHLILCCPLILLPSIFPSIRVFSNESALHIRWPKYWSFSINISPSNKHPIKWCSKFSKPGFNSTWTVNFQIFKLDLEKTEEPEIKLSISVGSSKRWETSRKISTSALMTMPKPLTVWITTNCGKFWKRWEYQTTWPASW